MGYAGVGAEVKIRPSLLDEIQRTTGREAFVEGSIHFVQEFVGEIRSMAPGLLEWLTFLPLREYAR